MNDTGKECKRNDIVKFHGATVRTTSVHVSLYTASHTRVSLLFSKFTRYFHANESLKCFPPSEYCTVGSWFFDMPGSIDGNDGMQILDNIDSL